MSGTSRRYAFVSDSVCPFNKGGKETRLNEITRRLASNPETEVHIYTMKWWDGPRTIRLDGVWFHAICKLYPLYKGDRRSIRQAVLFGLATLRLVAERFDVLDVDHMPFFPLFSARIVCALRGRPLFGTWHEVWGREYWREYMGGSGVFGYVTEWLAFRMPHMIISNSEHTTARLLLQARHIRVETVSLGVDVERIRGVMPADMQSDVMFAGRLLRNKNVDLLLDAVALIARDRDIRCLIVGEGPERVRLGAQARRLGVTSNVRFVDFVPDHSKLFGLMKSSRVLVLPSEREGFGMVVLEANACGIPVVTLDHDKNAARDLIISGQNGYLCDRSDSSLASAILLALDAPVGGCDQGIIQDWSAITRQVEQVYVDDRSATIVRSTCDTGRAFDLCVPELSPVRAAHSSRAPELAT